jgi:hypothetical protein
LPGRGPTGPRPLRYPSSWASKSGKEVGVRGILGLVIAVVVIVVLVIIILRFI